MCTSRNCSGTIPLLNLDFAKLTGLFLSHQARTLAQSILRQAIAIFEHAERSVIPRVRAYVQGTSRTLKEICGTAGPNGVCTSADQ